MSNDYVDLDALVPSDKDVKLGGTTYSLPGDLPLEVFIRVNKASELEEDDESKALDEMVDAMGDLFAWKYKGKPEHESVRQTAIAVLRSRGIRFNTSLLKEIYKEPKVDETKDEAGNAPS